MAGAGGHNNRQFATLPGHGPGMGRSSSQGRGRGRGYKNEEHDLIASYARRLAASSPEDELGAGAEQGGGSGGGERREDRNLRLVHELELKNAEIMREIARLRQNRATVSRDTLQLLLSIISGVCSSIKQPPSRKLNRMWDSHFINPKLPLSLSSTSTICLL